MNFAEQVIHNLIAVQDSIVRHVRQNRGGKFHIDQWQEITEIKEKTPYGENISRNAVDMYRAASRFHYECIRGMTETIDPHDEPWMENFQAPVVIELLKEKYPAFRKAVEQLIQIILQDENRAVEQMAMARHTGQHGPTWVFGQRKVPGTQVYMYQKLMEQLEADDNAKGAIAHSRVTTYANMIGLMFSTAVGQGKSLAEALQDEKEMLAKQWLNPIESQAEMMELMGFRSFDVKKYMAELKNVLSPYIDKCANDGIAYRNIIFISTLIGDLHHVGQMTYNMCRDDMTMAVFESVARCLENTLKAGAATFSTIYDIPSIFNITGTASAYILNMDGFASQDVEYLVHQRHRRLIQRNPQAYIREDMNEFFVEFIKAGEKILSANPDNPEINGLRIDLSPVKTDPVLQDPASYTWGQLPITARFSALIKFVDEPFMLISDPGWAPIWISASADPMSYVNRNPY
jgi:hypothetical protein